MFDSVKNGEHVVLRVGKDVFKKKRLRRYENIGQSVKLESRLTVQDAPDVFRYRTRGASFHAPSFHSSHS